MGFWQGYNLYTYVYNSPVNFVDPYGLQAVPITGYPDALPGSLGGNGYPDVTPGSFGGTGYPDVSQPGFTGPVFPDTSDYPTVTGYPDETFTSHESNSPANNGNGDVFQSTGDNNDQVSNNDGGSTEITVRGNPGSDGSTSQIRKEIDSDGNTTEVWHEVFDQQGNIIHRDWKGPGPYPPKKPRVQ